MDWIREENFKEIMKSQVEPYLAERGESGYFERNHGESIYYEHYHCDDPKGVIVISHGFTESIKKYTEPIYYMLQEGYDVWGVDHRGHGRSFRMNDNPYVVHVERFEDYVLDLVYFTENLVKKAYKDGSEEVRKEAHNDASKHNDLPFYLYCHSMGGCIGAWIIEEYPRLFDKAVLSSPMLGLDFGRVPVPVVYAAASIIGIGERRKNPFGSDGKFSPEPDFENSAGNSECRYYYYFNKTLEDPNLQTCAPSIQWGKQAARACSFVFSEADMIRIPVLLLQAGADTVVKNSAQDLFADWVENCEFTVIPGKKHELYMMDSDDVIPYWERVFGFLDAGSQGTELTKEEKINRFNEWQNRLSAYQLAFGIMGVDQTAVPPSEGAAYRAEKTAILQGEYRKVLQNEEMYEIISDLSVLDGLDEKTAREVELYKKQLDKERSIPADEYMSFSKVLDESIRDWLRAKKEDDFAGYAPKLQAVIDGYKRIKSLEESDLDLYDRILDDHQPGWNTARYDDFFSHVKNRVVPLVKEITQRTHADRSMIDGHLIYPADGQRRVMKHVCDLIGFTADWGRITESEHPLTSTISKGDVRFTTKYRENDPTQAILSTVHESGHAWFGHNVDEKFDGSIISGSISAGLHESQSRLCENHLGRSLAFWEKVLPMLKDEFGEQLGDITPEGLYKALNTVRPSLIRTESDEVTYPIHILIRYELEKALFDGSLQASDLEAAWNDKYEEYLGIRPEKPSRGVLQDMHWPYAYFGYFPTYALGSAMAAQFFASMKKDIDPEELIRQGRYTDIMKWLEEHVHRYGNLYEADEILLKATGERFNDEYYFRHLEQKYL